MSSLLCDYMQDGACKQARATLMLLQAGECYGATVARQFREMADWIKDQIREHSERKAGV